MAAVILRLAASGGAFARLGQRALRVAERELCTWIVHEAAKRLAPRSTRSAHRVTSAPNGFQHARTHLTMRRLARLVRARMPREDVGARIVWLLKALDDPRSLIARLLRRVRRLGRAILIAAAPPTLGAVHAGAADRIPAPDD